jgi:flagellar protein FlbD
MIKLTRLNGEEFYLNPHALEKVEDKADTVITMSSQVQYIVKEKALDIKEMIIEYRKRIFPNGIE